MTSRNTIPTAEEDYLEVDDRIPGQNYVCISFVSPEDILKQKEMYLFHRFMTQICGEVEFVLDQKIKPPDDATDEMKSEYAGINTKFVEATKAELRNYIRETYDGFKGKFDDFKYKHGEKLDEEFNKQCDFKTNVRGVKVRGVFDTLEKLKDELRDYRLVIEVSMYSLDKWATGCHGIHVQTR